MVSTCTMKTNGYLVNSVTSAFNINIRPWSRNINDREEVGVDCCRMNRKFKEPTGSQSFINCPKGSFCTSLQHLHVMSSSRLKFIGLFSQSHFLHCHGLCNRLKFDSEGAPLPTDNHSHIRQPPPAAARKMAAVFMDATVPLHTYARTHTRVWCRS